MASVEAVGQDLRALEIFRGENLAEALPLEMDWDVRGEFEGLEKAGDFDGGVGERPWGGNGDVEVKSQVVGDVKTIAHQHRGNGADARGDLLGGHGHLGAGGGLVHVLQEALRVERQFAGDGGGGRLEGGLGRAWGGRARGVRKPGVVERRERGGTTQNGLSVGIVIIVGEVGGIGDVASGSG